MKPKPQPNEQPTIEVLDDDEDVRDGAIYECLPTWMQDLIDVSNNQTERGENVSDEWLYAVIARAVLVRCPWASGLNRAYLERAIRRGGLEVPDQVEKT